MAKYVCDFDTVTTIGKEICTAASDINSAISDYNSTIDSHLSSWEGSAKTSFEKTNATQVATSKKDATYINELGEYIQSAAKSIQALEEELAGLNI